MKRVLIVDDKEELRKLIRVTLKFKVGYELFEADDGVKALELAKIVRPDLVILDVMMPGKDGYEVCTELKRDKAYNNPIVIMLTARAQAKDIEKGMQAGADHYLTKPFSPLQLVELMSEAFNKAALAAAGDDSLSAGGRNDSSQSH